MPGQSKGLMEGWKDGQTLFYRTLLANTGGPKYQLFNNFTRKLRYLIC